MALLLRLIPPIVIQSITITHGKLRQLSVFNIVEAGNIDRHILSADFRNIAAVKRVNPAFLAEQVLYHGVVQCEISQYF